MNYADPQTTRPDHWRLYSQGSIEMANDNDYAREVTVWPGNFVVVIEAGLLLIVLVREVQTAR